MSDVINSLFELGGGFAIILSIIRVLRDKAVAGISIIHVAFFSLWGVWNLWYYPHLDQMFSFWAGLFVVGTNLIWIGLLIRYGRKKCQMSSGH